MISICHLSRQDIGGGGGGYRAAFRTHDSLRRSGECCSRMVVARKQSDDPDVIGVNSRGLVFTEALQANFTRVRRLLGHRTRFEADASFISFAHLLPLVRNAQVIHLHFTSCFLSTTLIGRLVQAAHVPVVWTLMDVEPMTGGCHYPGGCIRYMFECGKCPQLGSRVSFDLSRWNWKRKKRFIDKASLTIVAPTTWLAERAKQSALFRDCRIETIPLAIDSVQFCPKDCRQTRHLLGLPQNKRIIFFGASNPLEERKGFQYLYGALKLLRHRLDAEGRSAVDIALVTAGGIDISKKFHFPFEVYHLGLLKGDDKLAMAYQAADIFVCPSVEDAGPMMIPEAMLCGIPVVAFDTGGAPDLIETSRNGYLATYKDIGDLANGLMALVSSNSLGAMGLSAREIAMRHHDPKIVAQQYLNLYRNLNLRRNLIGEVPNAS